MTALAMTAIGDPEDNPPLQPPRLLRAMPNDQDDPRTAATTPAPPTDREPPTNPEASEARPAINPPPDIDGPLARDIQRAPDDVLLRAMNLVLVVHEEQKQRDRDIFEPEGRFAVLQRRQHQELVSDLSAAFEAKVTQLSDELGAFAETVREKAAEQDKRIAAIEQQVGELKLGLTRLADQAVSDAGKIELLERELEKVKHARAPKAPGTPPGTGT